MGSVCLVVGGTKKPLLKRVKSEQFTEASQRASERPTAPAGKTGGDARPPTQIAHSLNSTHSIQLTVGNLVSTKQHHKSPTHLFQYWSLMLCATVDTILAVDHSSLVRPDLTYLLLDAGDKEESELATVRVPPVLYSRQDLRSTADRIQYWYSTAQHSTAQHSTAQYSSATAHYRPLQCATHRTDDHHYCHTGHGCGGDITTAN